MAMRVARVALAGTGALAVAAASQLDNDSPVVGKIYSSAVKPMLMLLDPETAHRVAVKAASLKILPAQKREDDPVLRTTLWGRTVRNPIGLAAGFDKDAEAIDGLFRVGFGLVEVASANYLLSGLTIRPLSLSCVCNVLSRPFFAPLKADISAPAVLFRPTWPFFLATPPCTRSCMCLHEHMRTLLKSACARGEIGDPHTERTLRWAPVPPLICCAR